MENGRRLIHAGPERQDDRRIISGIVHRLREGCRWRALADEYGPYTRVVNRYNRLGQRGLCHRPSQDHAQRGQACGHAPP